MPSLLFSEADLAAVRGAVAAAEKGTSGEIVPYVVPASDEYAGAVWKGATLGALAGALAAWALHRWGDLWGASRFLWMVVPPAAGAALGYLAAHLGPLRRFLAGHHAIERRVQERAAAAFLEQEVFRTRDRTGILLFLSLFERRVVVLGDSGIHQQVKPGEWDVVVRHVVSGLGGSGAGNPTAALVAAIRECGEILARHGLPPRPDDADELPNDLRWEGRK
jgi:putative membrane protein